MDNEQSESQSINTGGGAFVGGNVETGGGDFVGRDKVVHGDDVRGNKAGGDVIVATVGAGARNVAVGKNVHQQISETTSAAAPPSAGELNAQFALLMDAIGASPLTIAQQARVEARLELLQGEFSKATAGEEPDGELIVKQGDWLLANAAALSPVLKKFFRSAAVRQATLQIGEHTATWWQSKFGE